MKPIRIDNFEVRKYTTTKVKEVFYEIVKWEPCKYYGKLDEYLNNGYSESFGGSWFQKDNHNISRTFFDMPETCYTIADIIKDNEGWYLKTVLDRFCNLTKEEQLKFIELYCLADQKLNKHLKI
jgi:hypothetical protein